MTIPLLRVPARTVVCGIAFDSDTNWSQGSSLQCRTSTSKIELPTRSMVWNPVRSSSAAIGSPIDFVIRIPHQLCGPSRSVWSITSIVRRPPTDRSAQSR
ncbi:Uncharacterised protein [Mycobacteroides abscessus subsp. abscessus]|nr:Uncharacterised protein [Mycobacteroides abscessus subsp. abscessus]